MLARLVVQSELTIIELIGDASADLSIECFARVRWPELARHDHAARRVDSSDSVLVNGVTSVCKTAIQKLLDLLLKCGVVVHQLVELVLVQVTGTATIE